MTDHERPLLVTGGAGYIGAHFIALLEDAGVPYIVLDDLSRSSGTFVRSDRLVVGSIADTQLVESLCRDNGVATVVHFAAFAYVGESVTDPELYYKNNVANSFQFLASLRQANVSKIIFSSSCATYGEPAEQGLISEDTPQNPINPYGRTKLILEQMLQDYGRAYGLKSAILRYFNAAGSSPRHAIAECHDPETHIIPLALRAAINGSSFNVYGDDFATPDGTCIRDYIHVDDLAKAHLLAAEYLQTDSGTLQVNLGTGHGVSVKEILDSVERVTGLEVRRKVTARREGDPPFLVANVCKAEATLGWKAKHNRIDEIIATAYQALRAKDS